MSAQTIQDWRSERNAALRSLDMAYARRVMPHADDDVRLMALHKARYECTDLDDATRFASAAWLRRNGLGGIHGPLLPIGELPR